MLYYMFQLAQKNYMKKLQGGLTFGTLENMKLPK